MYLFRQRANDIRINAQNAIDAIMLNRSFHFHSFNMLRVLHTMCIAASKCADDRLKPFNGTCYLFVSYPQVDWLTAQQVCAGINGELASVITAEEQR